MSSRRFHCACLALLPALAGSAWAQTARPLTGEEIQAFFSSEGWEAEVDFHDGMHASFLFLPNGRVMGTNIYGGGSVHGRWHADLGNGWLCLAWDQVSGPLSGCMAVTRIGSGVIELRTTDTDEMLWHLELQNF